LIASIDHIVLTTRDPAGCIRFYTEALGMKLEAFKTPTETRQALKFGRQKINLHEWGREFTPRAHVAAPGTLDLCFIASVPDPGGPGDEDRRHRADPLGVRPRPGPEPRRDLRAGLTPATSRLQTRNGAATSRR